MVIPRLIQTGSVGNFLCGPLNLILLVVTLETMNVGNYVLWQKRDNKGRMLKHDGNNLSQFIENSEIPHHEPYIPCTWNMIQNTDVRYTNNLYLELFQLSTWWDFTEPY